MPRAIAKGMASLMARHRRLQAGDGTATSHAIIVAQEESASTSMQRRVALAPLSTAQGLLGLGVGIALLAASQAAAATAPTEKREPFHYDAKDRRDPFVALVRDGRFVGATTGSHADTSQPELYGILWDPGDHSIALLNDQEARIGDVVSGYKVIEIRKDAVVLSAGGW